MGFARMLGEQLAHPNGLVGRALGAVMDVVNRQPTRLALDLLCPLPGERILDVGCGTGQAMQLLGLSRCQVTGIDPSQTMLRAAHRRIARQCGGIDTRLVHGVMGALPFTAGSFDAALALNVLYFCDSEGAMLADLKRCLRPGGRLVVYVTHRATMRNWAFVRHGTHRLFDEQQLAATIATGGFDPGSIAVHRVNVTRTVIGLLAVAAA